MLARPRAFPSGAAAGIENPKRRPSPALKADTLYLTQRVGRLATASVDVCGFGSVVLWHEGAVGYVAGGADIAGSRAVAVSR